MPNYLESLLLGICEKLQLSPSLYKQANERYESITKILQDDDAFNNTELNLYPHGSFKLKTTVKPIKDEDYDLDFVAEITSTTNMSPRDLYDHIFRILKNDGIHTNMIEKKSRCIRINYANAFHMDIMPGKRINEASSEIIVPDKDLSNWYHHSDPKGFAKWFEDQARKQILFERNIIQESFEIEKVTDQELAEKLEPLRRAVQLVKRYRDIYCDENNREPVRSIIICALMGQISSFTGETIQIIERFCDYVNSLILKNKGKPFVVKNPVVEEELSEKWKEGNNFNDFVEMMKSLSSDIEQLKTRCINADINSLVKKMFGENVTNLVIKERAQRLNESRESGLLSVNSNGTITSNKNDTPIKKNTFYGDQ